MAARRPCTLTRAPDFSAQTRRLATPPAKVGRKFRATISTSETQRPRFRGLAYGPIRATLERQGTPIGAMDLLIAAHARSLGVTLVTNNPREFGRVEGLQIETWV